MPAEVGATLVYQTQIIGSRMRSRAGKLFCFVVCLFDFWLLLYF